MERFMKKIILSALTAAACSCPVHATTGYYLVLGGGWLKQKLKPNFLSMFPNSSVDLPFDELNTEKDEDQVRWIVGSMYRYDLLHSLTLSSIVYMSYDSNNIPFYKSAHKDTPVSTHKEKTTTVDSSLEFKNKFGVGMNVQIGLPIKSLEVYGLCGFKLDFPKLQGSLSGFSTQGDCTDKLIAYFGKEASMIAGTRMPEQKQCHNYLWQLNVGGGARIFLTNRFFVGAEASYLIPKTKKVKARYALYDPKALAGTANMDSPREMSSKLALKTEFKNFSILVQIGFRL